MDQGEQQHFSNTAAATGLQKRCFRGASSTSQTQPRQCRHGAQYVYTSARPCESQSQPLPLVLDSLTPPQHPDLWDPSCQR